MKSYSYVYTAEAVRSRLRRGAKSVRLCLPYSCKIVEITSVKEAVEAIKQAVSGKGEVANSTKKLLKARPALVNVAREFVMLWLTDDSIQRQYVVDQLTGSLRDEELVVTYSEVAAVTAMMITHPEMTTSDQEALKEALEAIAEASV